MVASLARAHDGHRHTVLRWLLALVLSLLAAVALADQPVPKLAARVTDTTATLSAADREDLDARCAAIEQKYGSQVAILIVPSTAPESIEQYSIRVVDQWKLGRAKVDDGVLVIVAKQDRRMRIEVGYGLEGAIPDAIAKRIITEQMTPYFRQGDFHGGLVAAVDAIGARIAGEALPPPPAGGGAQRDSTPGWLPALLFMAFVGFVLARAFGAVPGAAIGGAGGGFLAVQAGAPLIVGLAAGLVLFFVLLLFGAVTGLGRVGRHTYRSLPPVIFPGGRGGRGGGGFGGGGGGFGGGGASGGW